MGTKSRQIGVDVLAGGHCHDRPVAKYLPPAETGKGGLYIMEGFYNMRSYNSLELEFGVSGKLLVPEFPSRHIHVKEVHGRVDTGTSRTMVKKMDTISKEFEHIVAKWRK